MIMSLTEDFAAFSFFDVLEPSHPECLNNRLVVFTAPNVSNG